MFKIGYLSLNSSDILLAMNLKTSSFYLFHQSTFYLAHFSMSFIFFRYRQRLFFSSDINNLHSLQLLGLSKLAILIIVLLSHLIRIVTTELMCSLPEKGNIMRKVLSTSKIARNNLISLVSDCTKRRCVSTSDYRAAEETCRVVRSRGVIYIRSFFGEQNVDAASFSCYFENRVSLHAFLRCFTGDHIALRKKIVNSKYR